MRGGVHGEVEGGVAAGGGQLQVGQRQQRPHQLEAAGEAGAVEHGVAAVQHPPVDVQAVVVDQAEHQVSVGRVLARLLGLAANLPLELTQESLVAIILLWSFAELNGRGKRR